MNNQPKYRRSLNPNQLTTLQLIFKFRFVTAPLLATAFGNKSRSTTQETLQILEKQKYLGKRYDASYRLRGKQAIYYLLPIAIRELRDRYAFSDSALTVMVRNAALSESFMNHHLDVLKAYLSLKQQFNDTFHIFTQYELGNFSYFIQPVSDLYLNRVKADDDYPREYLLDIYNDKPPFVIKKRVDAYIKHCELEDWQTETKSKYPTVLISCPNARIEANIQTYATRRLDLNESDELTILTSTTKALLGNEMTIWSNVIEPDKLLKLSN